MNLPSQFGDWFYAFRIYRVIVVESLAWPSKDFRKKIQVYNASNLRIWHSHTWALSLELWVQMLLLCEPTSSCVASESLAIKYASAIQSRDMSTRVCGKLRDWNLFCESHPVKLKVMGINVHNKSNESILPSESHLGNGRGCLYTQGPKGNSCGRPYFRWVIGFNFSLREPPSQET